jgi:peptidoglycan-associated lipoprotein
MKTRIACASTLAALLVLAGCSSTKLDETPVESRTPTPVEAVGSTGAAPATPATPGGVVPSPQSSVATVTAGSAAGAAGAGALAWPAQRVVYFDFDSFVVRDDAKPVIDGHAKVLTASRARKLTLEGHADERGGREYNLALGQKRAEAVARALALLGVNDNQMEAVSFGEERPAVQGSNEEVWAKNRRVELKDKP